MLTMTSDRPLKNATVVVRGGRIAAVGPAGSTPVPSDARRIDGRGMFLMPGLIDMHAHLFADEYAPESAAPAELALYLALGTTSARLQIGRPQHLELRQGVREGTVAGPRLWVSSPQLSGDSGANTLLVRNAAEARAAVRAANASGYDFIKLTTNITPDVYDAVMAEVARHRHARHRSRGSPRRRAPGDRGGPADRAPGQLHGDGARRLGPDPQVGERRGCVSRGQLELACLRGPAEARGARGGHGARRRLRDAHDRVLHFLVRHRVHRRRGPGAARLSLPARRK